MSNSVEDFFISLAVKGSHSCHQNVEDDSKRPYVSPLVIVIVVQKDVWRDVISLRTKKYTVPTTFLEPLSESSSLMLFYH